jgi:hypothetical protein
MTDTNKFKAVLLTAAALIGLTLAYSVVQEHVLPGIEGYVQRKNYYERTISKKGLSEHKAMYWKVQER